MAISSLSITKQFSVLKDPRRRGSCLHNLLDIVTIAICGVIAGCNTWEQFEEFGNCHHDWFKRFLRLPNGIPSHDTFERVFACQPAGVSTLLYAMDPGRVWCSGAKARRRGR
jgi:hypothetical protein